MTTFRILLIALAVTLGPPLRPVGSESYEKIPIVKDLRVKFVLFSWKGADGSYRFALVPEKGDQGHSFLDKFDRNRTKSVNLETLENELAKLPKNSLVGWTKDQPRRIDYPEPRIVQRIKRLAARLHLDLQFNEMMYESPDV